MAQEAGDLRLETEDWRREAGSGKLEAWRSVCFDGAGDLWLETGDLRLETGGVALLRRRLET